MNTSDRAALVREMLKDRLALIELAVGGLHQLLNDGGEVEKRHVSQLHLLVSQAAILADGTIPSE